jgi:tetratricopeptide (TPR) repeat protein
VHAKLAHVSGWILLSMDYDLELAGLTTLQTDVARVVAQQVAYQLVPPGADSVRRAPLPAAIADYSQARADFTNGKLAVSLEGFTRALRADPRHLGSLEGLAQAHLFSALEDPSHAVEHFAGAQAAVDRALALDREFAGALTVQGALALMRDLDPARAVEILRRATEREPCLAMARLWYGEALAAVGALDAAVAEAQQGRSIVPMSFDANRALGHVEMVAGRYRELIEQSDRTLALKPSAVAPHFWRAFAYGRLGEEAAAGRERWELVAALGLGPPSSPRALDWPGVLAALARAEPSQTSFLRAMVAAQAGEVGAALAALERCRREAPNDLLWIAQHPAFERLRTEPRFRQLAAIVGGKSGRGAAALRGRAAAQG